MSTWIEKIKSDFIITLGDGKQFKPLWTNAQKEIEFNHAAFDFPNVAGTLVKRTQPKGTKYKIEIYFEGEDHLDISRKFQISSYDVRPWTINHPMYGSLKVQPISINFDDTKFNRTKIMISAIETISSVYPTATVVPVNKITVDSAAAMQTSASTVSLLSPPPASSMVKQNKDLYSLGIKVVFDKLEAQKYFNLFNKAMTAIDKITVLPLQAIQALQAVISAPSLWVQSVQQRMSLMTAQYATLSSSISNLSTLQDKSLFESNAGSILSAMVVTAATPMDGDYNSKSDVININTTIYNTYNEYIFLINSITYENGGNPSGWIPDYEFQLQLSKLVNYTVSNLLVIALDAKQEMSLVLEEDSNVIILAHRFFGLLDDDSTIDQFIANNKIGLSQLMQVKKGTVVIYYK